MELDSRITQALLEITFLERSISIIVLTVSPIVLVKFLGTPTSIAGWTIAGFWIANAIGALVAVGLIRNRHSSLLIGFLVIAISLPEAAIFRNWLVYMGTMILSGFGLSMVDAFLLPTMHEKSSSRERPQTGVASYSIALSLALVTGPLVAASAIASSGIFALFAVLAAISIIAFFLTKDTGILRSYSKEDTRAAIFPANILKVLRTGPFQDYYVLNFL